MCIRDSDQTEDLIYSINDMELGLFGEDSVDIDYERKNAEERIKCDEENYKIDVYKRQSNSSGEKVKDSEIESLFSSYGENLNGRLIYIPIGSAASEYSGDKDVYKRQLQ